MFHRPLCILNTSYIDQPSPNTVRYLLSVMLSLFYFFLVHCFVLDLLTLRIQVQCTHTCCTSYYLYAYVFPLTFPIILCALVPIILEAEFDTHDMYILIFMFIFTIDDKHHNSFYYKCLNVIYRPPSYCVAIIMTTLLMSSTGLCNMSLSVIIRYCRVRWTGVSVLGAPRLVLRCGNSTFVDRAYRWCRGVAACVFGKQSKTIEHDPW